MTSTTPRRLGLAILGVNVNMCVRMLHCTTEGSTYNSKYNCSDVRSNSANSEEYVGGDWREIKPASSWRTFLWFSQCIVAPRSWRINLEADEPEPASQFAQRDKKIPQPIRARSLRNKPLRISQSPTCMPVPIRHYKTLTVMPTSDPYDEEVVRNYDRMLHERCPSSSQMKELLRSVLIRIP
ncbi:hypothetical protein TSAR_010810 [Trichomalopsis sarcophagae]|uniref:Uncharacterized protein n=1 Tax=Trichomalopsis sarcophagae TaxID=543379 RepID=A0A232F578_9HYME|nr:hypothetical protein TSAR_010810 [Trichomalopsis sarcophagae]